MLQRLLHRQNTDISDAKISALLDSVSSHVKDFPFTGTFQLEGKQAVGQKLFDIAGDGDAEACGHLTTWGAIMAALKQSIHVDAHHFAACETNCPEP